MQTEFLALSETIAQALRAGAAERSLPELDRWEARERARLMTMLVAEPDSIQKGRILTQNQLLAEFADQLRGEYRKMIEAAS